jgi:hypothetical protein
MTTEITFREVTAGELEDVDGGFGILRALVVILTTEQQRAATGGQQPKLVHEPVHQ